MNQYNAFFVSNNEKGPCPSLEVVIRFFCRKTGQWWICTVKGVSYKWIQNRLVRARRFSSFLLYRDLHLHYRRLALVNPLLRLRVVCLERNTIHTDFKMKVRASWHYARLAYRWHVKVTLFIFFVISYGIYHIWFGHNIGGVKPIDTINKPFTFIDKTPDNIIYFEITHGLCWRVSRPLTMLKPIFC